MKKFLNFDEMITPIIIVFFYWIGIAGIIFGGLISAFVDFSLTRFLGSILVMAFGLIGWRVWCEILLVIFSINGKLGKLLSLKTSPGNDRLF